MSRPATATIRVAALVALAAGCGGFQFQTDLGGDTDTAVVDSDAGGTDGGSSGGTNGGASGGTNGGSSGGTNGGVTEPDATSPLLVEMFDGGSNAGLQYVELYNPTTEPVSLAGWALNVDHGGTETRTFRFPDFLLASGASFVACSEAGAASFQTRFGRACDATSADALGDGDDPMTLLDSDNRPKDAYGERRTDGTGTSWDYTNSVVKRKASAQAVFPFVPSQWTVTAGEDAAAPYDRN